MTDTPKPSKVDEHTLAEAFVARMTWPSMHWATQRLDYDAALALAKVALEQAPDIIATARLKEAAMSRATADSAAASAAVGSEYVGRTR